MSENPLATIIMKTGGTIKVELYPELAPNTAHNFISLANSEFYDGLTFHRVIEHFMIQGGCPDDTGLGGPGYEIRGEFTSNGFENNLRHEPGVISMARDTPPDTAGSQFFIMHEYTARLDGEYSGFGRVTAGMDEVARIASAARNEHDRPLTPEIIDTIRVECYGVEYPDPEVINS